jgi:hypothetical protein
LNARKSPSVAVVLPLPERGAAIMSPRVIVRLPPQQPETNTCYPAGSFAARSLSEKCKKLASDTAYSITRSIWPQYIV